MGSKTVCLSLGVEKAVLLASIRLPGGMGIGSIVG